jgi:hypothetical protein
MIQITLKPTRAAKKEFEFIDFDVMSQCITVLANNICKNQFDRKYQLKVDVSRYPNLETPWSHYTWKSNIICIHPFTNYKESYKLRRFITYFVHEFKHWTQDKLLKVSFNKNFKPDGLEYYRCPLEQDTREYTKLVLNGTIKSYKGLLELKQKTKEFEALKIKFYY